MATALLLKNGSLSVLEIRALPLVDSKELAMAIALSLYNRFDIDFEYDTLKLRLGKTLLERTALKEE